MKKILFLFCSIILIIIILPGCQDTESTVSTEGIMDFICYDISDEDEHILNLAVKKLQEIYPETKVNIVQYADKGYEINEYINSINTGLMSSNQSDIINISNIPALKYFKKGIFDNLQDIIDEDSYDTDNYYMNIYDACKYQDKLYAIPVHFKIMLVSATEKILSKEQIEIKDNSWDLKDFITLCQEVTEDINNDGITDRYALPKINISDVIRTFISTGDYIDYHNKKANFKSEEFAELIYLLTIFDNELTHPELSSYNKISYKDSNSIVFSGSEIKSFKNILGWKYMLGGRKKLLFQLPSSNKEGKQVIKSDFILSINKNSKFKEQARELIKILISGDIQLEYAKEGNARGFPVYKPAYDEQISTVQSLNWAVKDGYRWVKVYLKKRDILFIQNFVNSVNRYEYGDPRIEGIICKEIETILSEHETNDSEKVREIASNIAEKIQNKVELYLGE